MSCRCAPLSSLRCHTVVVSLQCREVGIAVAGSASFSLNGVDERLRQASINAKRIDFPVHRTLWLTSPNLEISSSAQATSHHHRKAKRRGRHAPRPQRSGALRRPPQPPRNLGHSTLNLTKNSALPPLLLRSNNSCRPIAPENRLEKSKQPWIDDFARASLACYSWASAGTSLALWALNCTDQVQQKWKILHHECRLPQDSSSRDALPRIHHPDSERHNALLHGFSDLGLPWSD
jgi:heme exporter protein D